MKLLATTTLQLTENINISRTLNGVWQIADHDGGINLKQAIQYLGEYFEAS